MCGPAVFPSMGDQLYMNMSYEQSNQVANFYIEDETTGEVNGCSINVSNSYFDGSTADWIAEQPVDSTGCINTLGNYSYFTFNDAYTALDSNGSWVTLGSQFNTQIFTGRGDYPTPYSQESGSLASDPYGINDSFSMNWQDWSYTNAPPWCFG